MSNFKSFRTYFPLTIFLFSSLSSLTQNNINTIITAAPFLNITPDAHAGAVGECGAATTPDVFSTYWNPSKLAFISNKFGIGVSYTPWLRALVSDYNLFYGAIYYKPNLKGMLGTSIRYFKWGKINSITGTIINPVDLAADVSYAHKVSRYFSVGGTIRYIYSDNVDGTIIGNSSLQSGVSVAIDVSANYRRIINSFNKQVLLSSGVNISNFGNKINTTITSSENFIPCNLRLGETAEINLNEHNILAWSVDLNKLLVPTPPIYQTNTSTGSVIVVGKNPNRSALSGALGSFTDAPGGWKEELHEVMISTGIEYTFNNMFSIRGGYFYEHRTKGNRKYFTCGMGASYKWAVLDFSYIQPTSQRSPLENTFRFSLIAK